MEGTVYSGLGRVSGVISSCNGGSTPQASMHLIHLHLLATGATGHWSDDDDGCHRLHEGTVTGCHGLVEGDGCHVRWLAKDAEKVCRHGSGFDIGDCLLWFGG